jgi:hypothetical protein
VGVVVLDPIFCNADGERAEAPSHSLELSGAGSLEGVSTVVARDSEKLGIPNLLAWEV